MGIDSIRKVVPAITVAGKMALEAQNKLSYTDRSLKIDGSVVTEVDKKVGSFLRRYITRLYPQANVLTEEEEEHPFDLVRVRA